MIPFLRVTNELGREAFVRADQIFGVYETDVAVKPGAPGRPRKDGEPRTIRCVMITSTAGARVACRGITPNDLFDLMGQSLGNNIYVVPKREPEMEAAE